MTKKVGFGIIGAGAISAFHASSMASLDNVELIGFYDPVKEAAENVPQNSTVRHFQILKNFLLTRKFRL